MIPLPFSQQSRIALVRWLGIAGAAFTLFSNMKSALPLSRLMTPPADGWTHVLSTFWRGLFAFKVPLSRIDAMVLSLALFVVMNSINAARTPRKRTWLTAVSLALLMLVLSVLFYEITLATPDREEAKSLLVVYSLGLSKGLLEHVARVMPSLDFFIYLQIAFLVSLMSMLAAILAVALPVAHRVTGLPFSLAAFTRRMWLILAGLAALLTANGVLHHNGM